MDLTIRGADITVNDELRAFAQGRVDRLDRYVEHVVEAKLELKSSRQRNNNNAVIAQLTLQTGRDILRAEEQDQDVRKAIGLAVNKLEVQARRVSERRSSRKRSGQSIDDHLAPERLPVDIPAWDDDELEEIGPVVRVKRFALRPMDVDEAIEQMELLGHDFFLFENREEDGVNVLYRRGDGTFGLLAPLTT